MHVPDRRSTTASLLELGHERGHMVMVKLPSNRPSPAKSRRSIAPIALPGPPSIQFWLGDGCFFGLCSVSDCHTYGFAYIAHERQYDPVEGRLVRLRNRFADFGDTVQAYLARLERDEQIHCSWVLAELLRTEPTLKRALVGYAKRRVPRVTWVQQPEPHRRRQLQPSPQVRNEVLRSRGEAMFNDRYAPLTPEP